MWESAEIAVLIINLASSSPGVLIPQCNKPGAKAKGEEKPSSPWALAARNFIVEYSPAHEVAYPNHPAERSFRAHAPSGDDSMTGARCAPTRRGGCPSVESRLA